MLLPLGLLLQQVKLGVDLGLHLVTAGSGDLPATGRWFDFNWSRFFSLWMNLLGPFSNADFAPRNERETRGENKVGTGVFDKIGTIQNYQTDWKVNW